MNPHERDEFLARMTAVWPGGRALSVPTLAIWHEHLERSDAETARIALGILERTKTRQPSLADYHEAYTEARPLVKRRSLPAPLCGICEDGFVFVEAPGRGEQGTVSRCPNGCKPPTSEQRQARRYRQEQEDRDRRRREVGVQQRLDGVRDPSGPARDDDRF